MQSISKNVKKIMVGIIVLIFMVTINITNVLATGFHFAVSPMYQKIVLTPGEPYTSTFSITNPGDSETDIEYDVELNNFYVNENYDTIHEEYGNTGEILKWTTINSPVQGTLAPNESSKISFTIDVPSDASAGGQYLAFTIVGNAANSDKSNDGNGDGNNINNTIDEIFAIDHLIFAEIPGNAVHQGEITDANVPSFLLSGNISGSSFIRNTGSIHGVATYKLQVFPLFSSEEIYTNEENPDRKTILPDRTLYNETAWGQTPGFGIFNVVYTVEFEGVTTQVSKIVIICPVWLLFIIFFVIAALIIWLVMRARARGKSQKSRRASTTAE